MRFSAKAANIDKETLQQIDNLIFFEYYIY